MFRLGLNNKHRVEEVRLPKEYRVTGDSVYVKRLQLFPTAALETEKESGVIKSTRRTTIRGSVLEFRSILQLL
jgi:hypothetical protein